MVAVPGDVVAVTVPGADRSEDGGHRLDEDADESHGGRAQRLQAPLGAIVRGGRWRGCGERVAGVL